MASPADEAMEAPEAGDLSAMEASMAHAEVPDEDWDEEEVEEEARTTDGLVDPVQDRAKKASERGFWPEFSSEDDESYAPGPEQEEDEDDAMRQFIEGHRWTRNEAWPTLLKLLQGEQAELLQLFQRQLASRPWQLRKSDALGRSMLHLALMRHRPDIVAVILALEAQDEVTQLLTSPFQASGDSDKDLIPCVHLALSGVRSKQSAAALQCLQLLLDQPVNLVPQVDNSGRSGLHMACALGSAPAVELLVANSADPGLQDDYGFMPLHYAIDSRNLECVRLMLEVSDRSVFPGELSPFYRCIDRSMWEAALLLHKSGWDMSELEISLLFDFAQSRGLDKEWNFVAESFLAPEGANASGQEVTWPEIFKESNTVVVTHLMCGRHGIIPEETDDPSLRHELMSRIPENPHRLEVLCGESGLLRAESFRELRWINEPNMAPIVDVLRVHEFWYVQKLVERVQQVAGMPPNRPIAIDSGDTKVSPDSWAAALHAAGAVLEAVDQVCNEQARNAFCAVRPPGHHLGPAGAVDKQDLMDDPEGSQGFCLLNNVAIGAAYAKCVYRHVIHKVAIIDFDVHHGNGTEAIVKNLRYRPEAPKEQRGQMMHGGSVLKLVLEKPPSCKPWLDANDVENVFFASIHGFGGGFYPGTGMTCNKFQPRIINVPLKKGSGPAEFRRGMRRSILPQLQDFDPDLIFISAGFDGHEDDLLGCCHLSEEDYIWATQQLMAIANRCCNGRLVSVLEGGYNTRGEVLSPFASAVASHVRTLMHTSQNYRYLDCEAPDEESFDQKVEDFYSSDKHLFIRREEARRLRRKRGWGDFGFAPLKVPRTEELFGQATSEAEPSEAKEKAKEEVEEMKEEKEKELSKAEAETEAPEALPEVGPEEPEVDEGTEQVQEVEVAKMEDEALEQVETEGEALLEENLEESQLLVEAADSLLQKVDAEEHAEEAQAEPWETE